MKIRRFPKARITNELSTNESDKPDNICPFCGKESGLCDKRIRKYNKTIGNYHRFHTFSVDTYTCSRCYAVWETEPYDGFYFDIMTKHKTNSRSQIQSHIRIRFY